MWKHWAQRPNTEIWRWFGMKVWGLPTAVAPVCHALSLTLGRIYDHVSSPEYQSQKVQAVGPNSGTEQLRGLWWWWLFGHREEAAAGWWLDTEPVFPQNEDAIAGFSSREQDPWSYLVILLWHWSSQTSTWCIFTLNTWTWRTSCYHVIVRKQILGPCSFKNKLQQQNECGIWSPVEADLCSTGH